MSRPSSVLAKSLRGIFGLFTSPRKPTFPDFLYRTTDTKSIRESVEGHADDLINRRVRKDFFTSDYETIRIAREVLKTAEKLEGRDSSFFEDNIFSQPIHSTSQAGSVEVRISDIGDYPKYKRKFEEQEGSRVMLCFGGPAAEDQAVLSIVISQIRSKLDDIVYLTRDYKESNVNHAAKQSHARHGNALNADQSLTGHALLPTIVIRSLLGVTPEEAIDSDYKKIDVPFTIDPKKLRIYFGNELNYLKQIYRKLTGKLTEHDINRLESILSQEILTIVEKESGVELSGGVAVGALSDTSSIHVSFSERNARGVEHENEEFRNVGIESKLLGIDDIDFFFGEDGKEHIHSAWGYKGDGHIKFDAHERNKIFAEAHGVTWIEGEEVQRIMITRNKDGKPQFAGVVTKSGEYIYGSDAHFTLGYKAQYIFDPDSEVRKETSISRRFVNKLEDILGLQPPLSSDITTATGVSVNAVFKKSDRMRRVIEKYGSTGEIAVTNSHWTMIAQDEDHVVMRITGGGNTGSEEYNPSYFLNVIANTRRIFGDDLVGVLSAYGCPRAVNPRNSTEFSKLAEGLVVSYGKGGTGNTKRHAEAVTTLLMMGFEKEIIDYFNKFQSRKGSPLGDKVLEIHKHLMDVEFIHDNTDRTSRRMGYDDSLSTEEMIAIAMMVAATSYVAKRKQKDSSKKVEELPADDVDIKEGIAQTTLKPTSSTQFTKASRTK